MSGHKNIYFQARAEDLQELGDWEKKKEAFTQAVAPVLRKWEGQFEKLFSSYSEELKGVTKTHGFGNEVQQKIVSKELERFEACKKRMFQLSQNACLGVVSSEVLAKHQSIQLSSKIVLIQAVVRRWLARRRYKELQKNERQRNKVAFEILETERTYVKNLQTLVKVFLVPLRQLSTGEEPLVSADDITKIFSNCEMIAQIHKQLLDSIEERMMKWDKNQLVGDIFVTWAPFLKLYTQYVGNYNTALSTLAECKKKDDAVEEFLKDCHGNPETAGKFFGDYQIMPVQRIPRYEMLLKELFKYTHKGHPDYVNLENALSKIQAVASKINESKRVAENLTKLLAIQGLFAGKFDDLVQPYRNYLREGTVFYDNPRKNQRVSRKSGLTFAASSSSPTFPLDECYAFLMTDILIISHKKNSLLDEKMFRYSIVCVIPLLNAAIEPLNSTPDSKVGFSLLVNQVAYSVYFESAKARDDWMDIITRASNDLQRNTSTLKRDEEPPEMLSLPQPSALKESKFTMLKHMAAEFVQHPPSQFSSTPINLNPPSLQPGSATGAPPSPQPPRASPQLSPQPSPQPLSRNNTHPKLPVGGSYVNLNSGSPIATRIVTSKIKQAIALYEEVYQLEITMFQVPIDLKTLFPQYYQQLPPNHQQLIWSRVFALKQKIEQIDGFKDRILAVLKSEKVATQLEPVISEGKTHVGNLQSWVKENYPTGNPNSQQPRALLIALVKWLQALLKVWEQIVEEECN